MPPIRIPTRVLRLPIAMSDAGQVVVECIARSRQHLSFDRVKIRKTKKLPSPAARDILLAAYRNKKMARSVQTYVRGNPFHFYEWLKGIKGRHLIEGPAIWIGGDCHVGNLGPIANVQNEIDIQIRDMDQTVIGNPVHDLIRLGLSLATAARDSDLSGVVIAQMMDQLMAGYEICFDEKIYEDKQLPDASTIKISLKEATRRSWKDLANERIEGTVNHFPLGKKFWPISREERQDIEKIFEKGAVLCHLAFASAEDDIVTAKVRDAAYWIKGCSSLGKLRYAVLLEFEHGPSHTKNHCLIDIKEAVRAAAPRHPGARMPRIDGERVVEGARHLSPNLGDRMIAAHVGDHSVFVRELLPQDMKVRIKCLSQHEAGKLAKYLAIVVGKAHARQMDAATRKAWRAELRRNRTKKLDAPSWLWTSIAELAAMHEKGYLEHARKYAMQMTAP